MLAAARRPDCRSMSYLAQMASSGHGCPTSVLGFPLDAAVQQAASTEPAVVVATEAVLVPPVIHTDAMRPAKMNMNGGSEPSL